MHDHMCTSALASCQLSSTVVLTGTEKKSTLAVDEQWMPSKVTFVRDTLLIDMVWINCLFI
jgi:hypothetical protein